MDFMRYVRVGLRWWWLIVLSMVLSGTASYIYSQRLPKIYSAKATLTVGSNIIDNPNPDVRSLDGIITLAEVYAELAIRQPIAQAVVDKLGLDLDPDEISNMIRTNVIPQVQLLEVSVLDVHPQRAQIIANTVVEELILQSPTGAQDENQREQFIRTQLSDLQSKIETTNEKIKVIEDTLIDLTSASEIAEAQSELAGLESLKGAYQGNYTQFLSNLSENTLNRLSIFEVADVPTVPIAPNIRNNVLMAAAAGLVLAISAIILLEFLDDSLVWRREKGQQVMGLPVLGAIGKMSKNTKLISQEERWSVEADMMRTLRSNIYLAAKDMDLSTLLITSTNPGDGKSFVSANLATTIASSGSSIAAIVSAPETDVILVDADLRRPMLHEVFDLPNLFGLADVLAAPDSATETMLKRALKQTSVQHMLLLPAGRTPLDPGSLLNSPRFIKVLDLLKTKTDIIILDSAPILDVVDTRAIANAVDAVALIVNDGKTRGKDVEKVIEYFDNRQQTKMLGLIFNRAKLASAYDYGSPSYYYRRKPSSHALPTTKSGISFWGKLWQIRQRHSEEAATLTLQEAADQLGVSLSTAKRWCEEGRLPAEKSRRQWVIRLEDMNAFITSHQWGDQQDLADSVLGSQSAISQKNGRNQIGSTEKNLPSGNQPQ